MRIGRTGKRTLALAEKFQNGWTTTADEFAKELYGKSDLQGRMEASGMLRQAMKYLRKQDVAVAINGQSRKGYGVYELLKDEHYLPAFAKSGTRLNRGVAMETSKMDVYVSNKPELVIQAAKEITAATMVLSNAIIKWSK